MGQKMSRNTITKWTEGGIMAICGIGVVENDFMWLHTRYIAKYNGPFKAFCVCEKIFFSGWLWLLFCTSPALQYPKNTKRYIF